MKKFSLNEISKYRNELFGLSIISIILFHFFYRVIDNGSAGAMLSVAKVYDNIVSSVGVEIFVFLSGVGLYFSMRKNSNVKQFYAKRMTRVLIPYAVWGGLYWICADILAKNEGITSFLYDFSFLSFWLDGERVIWYIGFIIAMYLIFPLIFKLVESKHSVVNLILMLVLSVGFHGALNLFTPEVYNNIEVAVGRIPIFIVGAYFGKRIYRGDNFSVADLIIMLSGVAIHLFGVLQRAEIIKINLSFSRYEFALFSISLIYICVWIFSKVKLDKVKAFLRGAGALSLELYMTHVTIDSVFRLCKIPTYKLENYIVIIIFSIIFSIMLHFSLENIKIKSNKNKKEQ